MFFGSFSQADIASHAKQVQEGINDSTTNVARKPHKERLSIKQTFNFTGSF